jgi:nucleoside phosphorylase
VCALDELELGSILRLPWKWKPKTISCDPATSYHEGSFVRLGQEYQVYAVAAPRMGMPTAAILSMKTVQLLRPEFLAMSGVTAGTPGKTRMGDIVVADPAWDWGSGKWTNEGTDLVFSQAPHHLSLDPILHNKFVQMSKNVGTFAAIKRDWSGDTPEHDLRLLVGPMASGAAVLADRLTSDRIKQQHRELLAIEMEAYAVYAAAQQAPVPQPKAFVLKSVVDFADGDKHDRWRKYAAYTSAQALMHFAQEYL